jgi:hypothetical protein
MYLVVVCVLESIINNKMNAELNANTAAQQEMNADIWTLKTKV